MIVTEQSSTVAISNPRSEQISVFQGMIDTTREAVIATDSTVRIIASNQHAHRAFARANSGLDGKRLSEVIRDPALHDAFRRALFEGASTDLRIEMIGTEKRTYDAHIAPFSLTDGTYVVGTFYDVTQIERLERVRQEFLSNISHELRTPLTSILAFVETLEDGAIDDSDINRRFLSTIRRNAERMHVLISDILELSLIESGNVSLDVKQVRIGHLVDEVFATLSSKTAEREIELINTITEIDRVTADPMRLEQMLNNLVDNAIKFNRTGGKVTVAVEQRLNRSFISVTDTGEGIVAAHAERIFERFYRVDRGRTRDVGGTGLGLAIVKHLARLHKGEISVNSKLGIGTTFVIELPSAQ